MITSPPYFSLRNYERSGQLGLEASVHDWVANLLPVIDELARVLKTEGSVWLNVGDSYSRHPTYGAPAKSFTLGPERLLLALSERGWIVRNKVVWAKPGNTTGIPRRTYWSPPSRTATVRIGPPWWT